MSGTGQRCDLEGWESFIYRLDRVSIAENGTNAVGPAERSVSNANPSTTVLPGMNLFSL